jgi:hypothetical protein
VQHHRQHLGRRDWQRHIRATDRRVCVRSVGRKLTADEFGEVNAIPATLAEQRVGTGHGSYAPIECLNVLVE